MLEKEELYDLYITKSMTRSQICQATGLSLDKIKYLLKKYEIHNTKENRRANIQQSRLSKDIPYDLLYQKYITENLTRAQVADFFTIPVHVLKNYLSYYHIQKDSQQRTDNTRATLKERYGVNAPMQIPEVLSRTKQTLVDTYGVPNIAQAQISAGSLQILEDSENLKKWIENYPFNRRAPKFLAQQLGCSNSTFLRYIHQYGYENLINMSSFRSSYEDELIDFLRGCGFVDLQTNARDIISPYEIDIYIPEKRIGIEFNGDYWHRDEKIGDKYYHQRKSLMAEEKGVFLYQIFEYEWKTKKDKILAQLSNLLGKSPNKIYGRSCEVKEVSIKEKKSFLEDNHLQGKDSSSVALGLYFHDQLVSLMTFCQPRFSTNLNCAWELSRFCCLQGYSVVGGASKLFKYFTEHYSGNILSYSNIAKTRGNIYRVLGFQLHHISEPNYVWVHSNGDIKTRYQTQMINEKQTMISRKYCQVFDCGNKVWVFYNL